MQTEPFAHQLATLLALAEKQRVAFMCAEAVPWRCHRSLIADALCARGETVYQIMSRVSAPVHRVTPWAHIVAGKVSYPPQQTELRLD